MPKRFRRIIASTVIVLTALLATQCINPMGDGLGMSPPPSGVSSASTSPLALPDATQGMAMMVYPESLESLLSESALIVIGEVGPVYQYHDHIIYSNDGRLLIEGGEKERAYAERYGIAATDLQFTVHEVFRDDGTVVRGDPIYLRVYGHVTDKSIEELLSLPPEELPPSLALFPPTGRHLFLLNPVPEGRGTYTATWGWGQYTIDGDLLRHPGTGEVLQIHDSGPITLSHLLETAKGEEAQFVPHVYRPDPSVTPPWLLETDPIELFKQQIVSQYMLSGSSDEERAWREEWVKSGGEQVLREQYELNVLLTQTEPNFLVMSTQTSYADNIPLHATIRVQNISPVEFAEKYLKDKSWADLVTVVEFTE